jgi:hypothetical protein
MPAFSARHSDVGAHLVSTTPAPRPVSVVDFALRLVELGLIPELTGPQAIYLEALDGKRPPLTPRERVETIRVAGRRHLRDLVAAHTIAIGHNVTVSTYDTRDVPGVREDILRLARAYCTDTVPRDELTELLHVFGPRPTDPKESPACPDASAPFASPAPPSPTRSSATTAGP